MSNSFVTANLIAERALPLLAERTAMLPLMYSGQWDSTYKKAGDTIQIRKPSRATAIDTSGDISGSIADVSDSSVSVQLSNQYGVPFTLTSKEMTMNMDDFERQVINPAVNAIAENINAAVLDLYKDIPYFTGTSGTTPDALSDLANVGKVLNNNDCPQMDRAVVMDFDALAKFQALDSLVEVDKAGTNQALRQGLIGQIYGMKMAADGQVKTHTAGGYAALADVTITGGAAGATSIELTSAAGASTAKLEAGDIFSIDDYQFTVTAQTAAAASGVIAAVSIYPALPKAFGDFTSAAVTFPDQTG